MPPKTVTCSICNQEVLKAQTLARKDGSRACRSHEGVEQEALELHNADQKRKAQELAAASKPKFRRDEYPHRAMPSWEESQAWGAHVRSHCWVCDQEGMSLREFYAEKLIAMQCLKLRGEPFNFFTLNQDIAKLMPGTRALVTLPYDDTKDKELRQLVKDYKIRDLLHFIRYVQICGDCIHKHGYQHRLDALMPHPTWEQLMNFMPISMALEPLIEEMAKIKENQS